MKFSISQVQGNPSIGETLKEIPWYTPSPEIEKTDGSVNPSKKVRIAKKEPKKPKAQTNAGKLAEQNPHTCILDSEIQPENIIPGSPEFVPYKRLKLSGKGSKGLKLKGLINNSEMVNTKQMLKLSEMSPEEKKIHNRKARDLRVKLRAERLAKANTKDHKTSQGGKAPHTQFATKAARKSSAPAAKPCRNWSIQAIHEIKRFQCSVDLLIPLLSFNHLIREVAQDFRYGLHFQSLAILALQEACEMFLVQLFESANLANGSPKGFLSC